MTNKESLLERAQKFHNSGDLQSAADIYRQVLSRNPHHDQALYLLGCLAHQTANNSLAVDLLRKAADVKPEDSKYQRALAVALFSQGFADEAELRFRRAISLNNRADDYASLATILRSRGRINEAIEVLEEGIGPLTIQAQNLSILRQLLRSQNRESDASKYLHKVSALLPLEPTARCEFADALLSAGDAEGAGSIYQTVLSDDPQFARAWYSAGSALESRSEFATAVECYTEAAKLRPDWLEARHNLGRAMYEIGQVGAAFEQFKWCADLPDEGAKHSRAMMAVIVPGVREANNEAVLRVRQNWVQRDVVAVNDRGKSLQVKRDGMILRIGYVSSFFHRDNWMKPVWGLINRHNRDTVQVNLFSDAPKEAIRHGYKGHTSDLFFDTSKLSNAAFADLIRKQEIDVLIDLNGYSNMSRLPMFQLHPAPIIVGWFNMYATSGMDSFDYLIGDSYVIPADEERFYSERIVRVDGSYLTFDVGYPVPPIGDAPCLRTRRVTFGSLGSQYKITNEVIAAWSRILLNVPGSSLLLKNKHLASQSTRRFVTSLFARNNISDDRLQLEGPDEHYRFLEAYNRIDLALDTFPYNGGTTTTEAIWQGVPVLTFSGDRWASRTSLSIMRAGGLDEFVADDCEGFVDLGVRLGNSDTLASKLVNFRKTVRSRLAQSTVCNTDRFARNMESIFFQCARNGAS